MKDLIVFLVLIAAALGLVWASAIKGAEIGVQYGEYRHCLEHGGQIPPEVCVAAFEHFAFLDEGKDLVCQ